MGDQGPWVRHIDADHDERIAYWAPLLQLLVYGLGWTRPDIGLATWLSKGCPVVDPVLRVVNDWWGQDGVIDVIAWAGVKGGVSIALKPSANFGSVSKQPHERPFRDNADLRRRRTTQEWQRTWGGGSDSMHLTHHVASPLILPQGHHPTHFDQRSVDAKDPHAIPRFSIVQDTYAGWYANFFRCFPTSSQSRGLNGRSVRVEIFVRPVGWLGEFRQHSTTRLWFRGRSSVHLWGQ